MVIVYVGVVAMDRHRVSGLLLAAPGTDCLRRARSRAQLHAAAEHSGKQMRTANVRPSTQPPFPAPHPSPFRTLSGFGTRWSH
jgi:hypothetical protein